MSLDDDALLKMNWFEAGALRAALERNDMFKKLPKTLQLKMEILFTQAYLSHESLGKKAAEDIKKFERELRELEKSREKN